MQISTEYIQRLPELVVPIAIICIGAIMTTIMVKMTTIMIDIIKEKTKEKKENANNGNRPRIND